MTKNALTRLLPAAITISLASLAGVHAGAQAPAPPAPERKGDSLDKKLDSPFAAFRFGVVVSPVLSLNTGLDVTFPRLRLGPSWTTRADIDLTARFNSRSFGSRRDAEIGFTLCQVYTPGGVNRGRYFGGAGVGPTLGPASGLSGKVFAGINITPVASIEVEAQFHPDSTIHAVLMLRLAAL